MAIRRTTGIILLALLLVFAGALANNSRVPAIRGYVAELVRTAPHEAHAVPRPRAEVLIIWRGDRLDNPADSTRVCLRAVRVSSGADGSFSRPAWWKAPAWPLLTHVTVSAYVYAHDYVSVGPFLSDDEARILKPGMHLIKPDAMAPTRDQWLQSAAGCRDIS